MTQDARTLLVRRLTEDLVGPGAQDERLEEKPSDRYLTGILFPQRTSPGAEEDDRLDVAAAGEEDADDGSAEEVPSSVQMKPAAAGISFCCEADGAARIRIVVTGGTYGREPAREAIMPAGSGSATGDSPAGGASAEPAAALPGPEREPARSQPSHVWKRTDHAATIECDVPKSGAIDVKLDDHGLAKFRIHITVATAGTGQLATVVLINDNEFTPGSDRRPDELALFQAGLRVSPATGTRFPARPVVIPSGDEDAMASALLYRDTREFATGHTCSARWESEDGIFASTVATSWLPQHDVRMVSADGGRRLREAIAARSLTADPLEAHTLLEAGDGVGAAMAWLPEAYEAWIDDQRARIAALPPTLAAQAHEHVRACESAAERMRRGIALLDRDEKVRHAFHLMSHAMDRQRRWATGKDLPFRWRPFQLGFILHSIESIADPSVPERGIMDLLWFPTGGGKTEAYLGLIAFTLFLRRLRRATAADRGGGTCCIMRYTLRLLTLQQFQRASSLILACESIRRRPPAGLGDDLTSSAPISIGLWVGGSATPNDFDEALEAVANSYSPTTPKQLTACPCCHAPLDWEPDEGRRTITVRCSGTTCSLSETVGDLPILTVDELIYREPPTLLFATIDKFAQIVRKEQTTRIFNAGVAPPPELIIQDELHLISGPLGTLAAVYECAVDRICSRDGVPPKIIGSTATIRRAGEQIRALFDRGVSQFPPPGIDADDSCFAAVPEQPRTRRYLGVTTAGRSAKFTLQAVYASLLQADSAISNGDERDGYHTLVGYFNSLRELGGALVLAHDDVPASIRLLARRRAETEREAREIVELTSRVSQSEIRDLLDRLDSRYTEESSVDIVLATNMISVGVDVARLALMVVFGQPKGIAEYIQATSRVGRVDNEGLVVTVFNNAKARDRSHYETFSAWHGALYRGVEATSVTPFASRARDRALHAAVVAVARHLVPTMSGEPVLGADEERALEDLVEEIAERAARVDPQEAGRTRRELRDLIAAWRRRATSVDHYWWDQQERRSLLVSAEQAATRIGARRGGDAAWPTLNSMRNVEPGTPFRLTEGLAGAIATDNED